MTMAYLNLKVNGADDIIRNIRNIPEVMREKVLWPAMIEAAEALRDIARENAHKYDDPTTPRSIPLNIVVNRRVKRSAQERAVIVQVGIRRKGQGGNTYYWWWATEFGTRQQRARPIFRPALENNIDRYLNIIFSSARHEMIKLNRFDFMHTAGSRSFPQ